MSAFGLGEGSALVLPLSFVDYANCLGASVVKGTHTGGEKFLREKFAHPRSQSCRGK